MTVTDFPAGTLINARGRDWLVLPGASEGTILARPLGGRDDETTVLLPQFDNPKAAIFDSPTVEDRGDAARARLLRDALRLSFRATSGPFRSFAQLAVTPRNYQLVPLMMATAQETTRLLIADGVGVGKTVEAGLIAAELLATGDAQRLAVLCSPQLAPQWQTELRSKFGIKAELLLPSTANRLKVPWGSTVYEQYPYLIISTDFIKQRSRRDEFALKCPELVIVDEAHTCIAPTTAGSSQAHQRYTLLRKLADDPARHLLLLTATPHSGDDGAWQSLVGLLDNRLGELPADLSGPQRDEDRKLLAQFLIQRQRADIREYLDEDTPFPKRERAEESYKLTPEYRGLFDKVMRFAREQVADPSLNNVHQRVRWWSAIALLRSIASSPAAAEQTLLNRSELSASRTTEDADSIAAPRVLDVDLDDAVEGDDTALGADTFESDGPDGSARRRLRELADIAGSLKGVKGDAKLKRLIVLLAELLAEGYHPIVFCRYIPTAEYLAEHLGAALTKKHRSLRVESVTGSLPPEERQTRVSALTAHDGPRLLIATDCLSEGVNLQDGFTAVVHYDLAWNPTRHEQREGRVDRFGQRADIVRAITYYGVDNGIDGVVLDVLIRRHERIRRSTGVSVPIPVDSTTVMTAIWESLLLRGNETDQLALDLGSATSSAVTDAVEMHWTDAAEREKVSRSRFRQASLSPDAVAETLADVRRSLGGPVDAEVFVRDSLTLLSGQLSETADGFAARIDTLPPAVREQLPPSKNPILQFHRSFPVPAGDHVLSRTDPTVESIARYVLDAALDPELPPTQRPARRAGVIRTTSVEKVTTLLVVRFRLELIIPGAKTTITQVAEDAQFLAFTASVGTLSWLEESAVEDLLAARPTGNVADELARTQLDRILGRLDGTVDHLTSRGEALAAAAVADHRKVRRSSKTGVKGIRARLLPPPDVLGVYVYLPDRSAS
ncbi:helicase-related protein [Williamsia sp. 1135]|uniref:helicase-related protein n=1 Tax=Williamsia sp. 1135 TaxID=1889262 RepID=UPI000A11BDD0|nr:helicase-related protein [Williamsia sp. 1135]ORM37130.1 helicase [Williamsia sp. 1135]